MSQLSLPDYAKVTDELNTAGVSVTAAEMHGLLVGMLSGGLPQNSDGWQSLLFDYTNDGMGWPMACLAVAEQSLKVSKKELSGDDFELSMLLPEEDDLIEYSLAVSEWVSHFVSGLGLIDAQVNKASSQIKEALQDLLEIAKLEIDPEDDLQEQAMLLEQVVEHVKICVLSIHTELGEQPHTNGSNTIH